jgi:hypothetical protein
LDIAPVVKATYNCTNGLGRLIEEATDGLDVGHALDLGEVGNRTIKSIQRERYRPKRGRFEEKMKGRRAAAAAGCQENRGRQRIRVPNVV